MEKFRMQGIDLAQELSFGRLTARPVGPHIWPFYQKKRLPRSEDCGEQEMGLFTLVL
jgi:hypothetical protein